MAGTEKAGGCLRKYEAEVFTDHIENLFLSSSYSVESGLEGHSEPNKDQVGVCYCSRQSEK